MDLPSQIPKEIQDKFVKGATWKTSPGISLEQQGVEALGGVVVWQKGDVDTTYVRGVHLILSCQVRVESGTQPGPATIQVDLPGISELDSLLQAKTQVRTFAVHEPRESVDEFMPNFETVPGTYLVEALYIDGSRTQKWLWTNLIDDVLIVVMIVAGAFIILNKILSGNSRCKNEQ